MDEDLYDEFGNYIGPELRDEEEDRVTEESTARSAWADEDEEEEEEVERTKGEAMEEVTEEPNLQTAVILHEDKKYYPDASDVYPRGTEILVQEEDAQPLTVPIIEPIKKKSHELVEEHFPPTTFTKEFMLSLMEYPELIRNVAIVGHLHHGKTTLVDMLVQQTHDKNWKLSKNMRYTDTRKDEQERGLSLKASPISLVLQNTSGKSFLVHLLDTPGHVNFTDEVVASLRLADGVVLVVDVVEGVMLQTERVIRLAFAERLPLVVVLNKMDRLILELKLPPQDAYFKLRHTLDQLNELLAGLCPDSGKPPRVSPELGNVVFASTQMGWCFTLHSFAKIYADTHGGGFDPAAFAERLWGDLYFDGATGDFRRRPPATAREPKRTFVEFILEPLYKLYAHVVGEDPEGLQHTLAGLGLPLLRRDEYFMDTAPLLKLVLARFFGSAAPLVDAVSGRLPSPKDAARAKIELTYAGALDDNDDKAVAAMLRCDAAGPLRLHVVKLFPRADSNVFDAFGRVLSGTVRSGMRVRVLGEAFAVDGNEEDIAVATVGRVWLHQSRYRIDVSTVPAGNWALVEGIDESIVKTATVVDVDTTDERQLAAFRPLRFPTVAAMKVAVEPLQPSELPKMVDGLRRVVKTYPQAATKVEESGEHTIAATGELYLDTLLADLRLRFGELEVKVSDPIVAFSETVVDVSAIKCFADSPNRRNRLAMVAEPLEPRLTADLEAGAVSLSTWEASRVAEFFRGKHGWDALAARRVWAFGPDPAVGPNVLVDDTLPGETPHRQLLLPGPGGVRDGIVAGFVWGVREGPLCEEPIRGVKFRLVGAAIDPEPLYHASGQLIPTARRVVYSAFLTASPRLMEPVYLVELLAPPECLPVVFNIVARRRGHVVSEAPKPGTPLSVVKAYVPLIDSFGFETDVRTHTLGQAFGQSVFDHWEIVPGDPLDRSVQLRPLEPAVGNQLARDFMVKTRRRKGLPEDVAAVKFFDDDLLAAIKREDLGMSWLV